MSFMRKISYTSYQSTLKGGHTKSRLLILTMVVSAFFAIIFMRLFQLQIMKHAEYSKIAEEQHFGAIDLPARRGDIYVKDTHSGELSKLATNTTLDLLYIDPMVADKKDDIAKLITPIVFPETEYQACVNDPKDCFYDIKKEKPADNSVQPSIVNETIWDIKTGATKEVTVTKEEPVEVNSYTDMLQKISDDILKKISKQEVDFAVLKRDASDELMAEITNERLPGIFVDTNRSMIYGDPTMIQESQLPNVVKTLSSHLQEAESTIEPLLTRRKVRYVYIKNKLTPEASKKIKDLKLKGLVLVPEHWRFYPEGQLASNVVGFINQEKTGQYGIEGYFNIELEGKKGTIYAESDPFGRQITVGETKIVNAVDGDTIVLTIDRVVQKKVEDILAEEVKHYRADGGQVIIMNPFSGAIVAMANYPTFDPNDYGASYTLRKFDPNKEERPSRNIPVFKKDEKGHYVAIQEGDLDNKDLQKYVYENSLGPGVFKNKVISEYYEPGSVFKPIVMSIALDDKEVNPETTYVDDGPLKIDNFEIKNSTGQYHGVQTMTQVLEKSLNTGMSWVAKKLGKKLMYKYIKDFGFGEYTNIDLEGETKGAVDYYSKWSKAQQLTTSFGQGIVVTPLQMITAWSALANGGKLVQPYIVDSVIRDNQVIKTEPEIIHRVISEEASSIITSMLVSVVKNGGGHATIPGYLVAGKTGTAQIAGKYGLYEKGEGSTITSFMGFFPALKPQFVVMVKLDRPRIGQNTWGETTAAPTFKRIAQFLIDYYSIEPSS